MEITQLQTLSVRCCGVLIFTQQEKTELEEEISREAHRFNQDIDALRELADTDPLTGLPIAAALLPTGKT